MDIQHIPFNEFKRSFPASFQKYEQWKRIDGIEQDPLGFDVVFDNGEIYDFTCCYEEVDHATIHLS